MFPLLLWQIGAVIPSLRRYTSPDLAVGSCRTRMHINHVTFTYTHCFMPPSCAHPFVAPRFSSSPPAIPFLLSISTLLYPPVSSPHPFDCRQFWLPTREFCSCLSAPDPHPALRVGFPYVYSSLYMSYTIYMHTGYRVTGA
jgi:hypothetical protein